MDKERHQKPVSAHYYDETYYLSACEGYQEFVRTEGQHLSRRLEQAFLTAEVIPGMMVLDIGCGRGEILSHCARLGAQAYGIDYSPVAVRIAGNLTKHEGGSRVTVADAKLLPFPSTLFDRVLMFDLVEHLQPWELQRALAEVRRVLQPEGRLIIHTAPNAWYNRFAYPVVRFVRTLTGEGRGYPRNPRAIIPANLDVHVNEQSPLSLRKALIRARFRAQVWLDTPPQDRDEGILFQIARHVLFNWPPFRWFFEREVFAVAGVNGHQG
ncbi:MAG: class I SAM-dependent methyltransferase [Anaerolineae bacterium]